MSVNIPDVAITEFIADLHTEFRSMGFLTKNTMRTKTNVRGRTVQFPVLQQGLALRKALQDDVVPMNVDYDPVTLTLQDWYAAEYTDIFSQSDVNWDDKMELVQVCTRAIGRRSDQLAIDALAAAAPTAVGDFTTGFTWDLFREAFSTLRGQGAIGGEMHALIPASAEAQLLDEAQITSSDFVNNKVIAGANGIDGNRIMGVIFHVIPDMAEGGLPLATANRRSYIYSKEALAYASGLDLDVHVDWVAQKTSWLVNALLKANAAVIDARGVVEVRTLETA